jgi:hypothetical protein
MKWYAMGTKNPALMRGWMFAELRWEPLKLISGWD